MARPGAGRRPLDATVETAVPTAAREGLSRMTNFFILRLFASLR